MPQPTASDVHVNMPLTNISVAWMQNQQEFIADRVFPTVPVKHRSDRYYVYDRDNRIFIFAGSIDSIFTDFNGRY